jgi:hypothetical protein
MYSIRFHWIKFYWNYIPWLTCDIDKLGLGFDLLFDRISCSVGLLCFETIVNTNNDITYNERSNELLTTKLDMSLIELKWFICDWIKWNWCEPRNHMVTQPTIKIEIWSQKAKIGLIKV